MVEKNKLDKIKWSRGNSGFEFTLTKYIIKKILKLVKGPRVLDVGCGDGLLTEKLTEKFDEVIGIDGSKDKIQLARKNAPEAKFEISLFEDFNTDNSFNTILMVEFLEHVSDPIKVLKKAKKMLEKEGCLIILVPNALSLNRRIGKQMGLIKNCYELSSNDIKNGHKRFYDINLLSKEVKKSGLNIEEVGGIFLKPLSNKQMESWDEKVCDALYEIGEELPDYCGMIYVRAV